MTTWLHFIGKAYYSTDTKFIREAQRFGITRRVSLATLRNMAWGDRVLLAHKSGASAVVFGQFTVDRLSGFSADGAAAFARVLGDKVEYRAYPAPKRVERGCGSYVVHGEFTIRDTPVVQVVEALKGLKDPGKLMVGGTFEPLFPRDSAQHWACVERVRLKSVPFMQGFRPFDYAAFRKDVLAAVSAAPSRAIPVVTGHFYSESDHAAKVAAGIAELVGDYRRGSHYEQGGLEL